MNIGIFRAVYVLGERVQALANDLEELKREVLIATEDDWDDETVINLTEIREVLDLLAKALAVEVETTLTIDLPERTKA